VIRIPCKSEDCLATILPTTAEKTGGYCMPCRQEMEHQERQQYIKENRKDVDLYEGIDDPVEILKIMHTPSSHDPLIHYIPYVLNKEQIYVSLSEEDTDRMLGYGMSLVDSGDEDRSQDILLSLLCYKNKSLATSIQGLISYDLYYHGILFKDASEEERDQLLNQVEHDEDSRNHLLVALAWIGDEQVVKRFCDWRKSPPQWVEELHIRPELYANEAGWELTKNGNRRNLFHEYNYAIEKIEASDSSNEAIELVTLLTPSSNSCLWCGGKLTTLLNLKVGHPSLHSLSLTGERLKIETCVICSCYSVVFMEVDSNGESKWSTYNQKPDYMPVFNIEDYDNQHLSASKLFRLASQSRNSYHAAHWTLESSISQVGGYPTWIQDAEYPICPCCSKHMIFISQLDWGEVVEYGEGIYYTFICSDCRITATSFQQS